MTNLFDDKLTWNLASKFVAAISGPTTIFFLLLFFSPVEQGLFYSLIQFGYLSAVGDVGFTAFFLYRFSKFIDKADPKNKRIDIKEDEKKDEFLKLNKLFLYFISATPIIIFIILSIAGLLIFADQIREGNLDRKFIIIFCFIISLDLNIQYFRNYLEGLGFIKDSGKFILIQIITRSSTLWIFMFLDAGLYALSISLMFGLMIYYSLFFIKYSWILKESLDKKISSIDNPFQSKFNLDLFLGWFFGAQLINANIYFILHLLGVEDAGRFGISLALMEGIYQLSFVFFQIKIPEISNRFKNGDTQNALFLLQSSRQNVLVVNFLLFTIFIILFFIGTSFYPFIETRLLPLTQIGMIFIFTLTRTFLDSWQVISRPFGRDILYKSYIISGIFLVISNILLIELFGIYGCLFSMIACRLINIPIAYRDIRKFRRHHSF